MIIVTCYNEDEALFCRTLQGIIQNIGDIVSSNVPEFGDTDRPAWHDIVVCLVFDGLEACDKSILDFLAMIGVYQENVMRKDVDGKESVAHIFEYTTQICVTADQKLLPPCGNDEATAIPPIQFILCLKQRNAGKINSHRWAIQAFGPHLKPELVVMLDVGTQPCTKAIGNMWTTFHRDGDLGGACGNVSPSLGRTWNDILNPLVAAQNFEYKVSCILDRPLESVFGYLTVLPGCFSAYRYRALMGSPLEQYFRGDWTLPSHGDEKDNFIWGSGFLQNLFLAEDRVLSFELFSKPGCKWHVGYIKSARAETDIPESTADFITQRRRWCNGAFAATIYSSLHFFKVYRSGHSIPRILLFHVQMVYNIVTLLLSWFGLAAFFLTTFTITDIAAQPPKESDLRGFPFGHSTPMVNAVIQGIYATTVLLQLILAFGSKPKNEIVSYITSFSIFAVVQLYFGMNGLYLMARIIKAEGALGESSTGNYNYISTFYSSVGSLTVLITCCAVFGVYYITSMLYLDLWHMFTSYPQYLFVLSSYTNIVSIYAFTNWHDVSWGHKVSKGDHEIDSLPSVTKKRRKDENTAVSSVGGVGGAVPSPQVADQGTETGPDVACAPYTSPSPAPVRPREATEDTLKSYRTKLVAVYIFSNLFLCTLVINESFDQLQFLVSRPYNAGLFRLCACCLL